jgi:hypothetical protein
MESRSKALSHLRKNLRSGRGEELPMKKVSVIAPTTKGLEEGLKKAEDLMESGVIEKVMKPEMESEEHESMESKDYENGEESEEMEEKAPEDMSREELIAMVKEHREMLKQ